jgi:MEDS: MEthanogen/methylotroph, DcmR Sensory domain
MKVSQQVLQFIDNLSDRTHSVIFYEDLEYGRAIQYRYMKVGLLNGEKCVITTHEDDAELTEKEMIDFGIDVEHHKKANLLQILKIRDPREHPQGLVNGIEQLRRQLWTDPNTSLRIFTRFIKKVDDDEEKEANMFVERTVHTFFEKFPHSVMCPYPVKDIKSAIDGEWMQNHLRNHHAAFFAFKNGKGLAMDLRQYAD